MGPGGILVSRLCRKDGGLTTFRVRGSDRHTGTCSVWFGFVDALLPPPPDPPHHTHTHTHTQIQRQINRQTNREREGERESEKEREREREREARQIENGDSKI